MAMKQFLESLKSWLIVYRIDVAGENAGKRRPNWGETIFVYMAILLIILICALCVHPGIETTGWYGTQHGQ